MQILIPPIGCADLKEVVVVRSGGSISSAKVGDELAIHFEVEDLNSPYEIFVRDLVASDGVVSSIHQSNGLTCAFY